MRANAAIVFAVWLISLFIQPALAERRVALVIGNSAYQSTNPLPNPINDSNAMAAVLKGAGFDIVDLQNNLKIVEMRRALREFASKISDADVAVVYFAGHGIEVDHINYIIPVDAILERDTDAPDEAISLDRILTLIEPAKQLRLVILDACRDNPFVTRMKRTTAPRAIGIGLAKIEPASPNTLVAYAAKAGTYAYDGAGAENSPFTAALIKHLFRPGLDLRKAFGFVRDDVLKATRKKQEPYTYGSLGGDDVPLVPAPAVEKAPAGPVPDPNSAIRRDYELAERVGTKDAWDSFLTAYPDGFYSDLARAQRKKLAAEEARAAATEAARLAVEEQARLAKQGAKAEEQTAAAARTKAAEEARIAAEKKAAEEAKAAEDARIKTTAPTKENAGVSDMATPDDKKKGASEKPLRKAPATSTARRTPPTLASRHPPQDTKPATRPGSGGYHPQGSGVISDGSCNCKKKCNGHAAIGQLSGAKLAQCKSDCEQTYSGCIAGSTR